MAGIQKSSTKSQQLTSKGFLARHSKSIDEIQLNKELLLSQPAHIQSMIKKHLETKAQLKREQEKCQAELGTDVYEKTLFDLRRRLKVRLSAKLAIRYCVAPPSTQFHPRLSVSLVLAR